MSQAEVDLVMTKGYYIDRRGRQWAIATSDGRWGATDGRYLIGGKPFSSDQMRLLIKRDIHRDECVGIHWCLTHPVVSVDYDGVLGLWKVWGPGDWFRGTFRTLSDAMDAARALEDGAL